MACVPGFSFPILQRHGFSPGIWRAPPTPGIYKQTKQRINQTLAGLVMCIRYVGAKNSEWSTRSDTPSIKCEPMPDIGLAFVAKVNLSGTSQAVVLRT